MFEYKYSCKLFLNADQPSFHGFFENLMLRRGCPASPEGSQKPVLLFASPFTGCVFRLPCIFSPVHTMLTLPFSY